MESKHFISGLISGGGTVGTIFLDQFPCGKVWFENSAFLLGPYVGHRHQQIHQPIPSPDSPEASIIPEGREERRQSEVPELGFVTLQGDTAVDAEKIPRPNHRKDL